MFHILSVSRSASQFPPHATPAHLCKGWATVSTDAGAGSSLHSAPHRPMMNGTGTSVGALMGPAEGQCRWLYSARFLHRGTEAGPGTPPNPVDPGVMDRALSFRNMAWRQLPGTLAKDVNSPIAQDGGPQPRPTGAHHGPVTTLSTP